MLRVLFVIPINDNDGRCLGDERILLEADLTAAVGGWTRLPSLGGWKGPDGQTWHEAGHVYFVTIEEHDGDRTRPFSPLCRIERCLQEFKARTLQKSIYVELTRDVEVMML